MTSWWTPVDPSSYFNQWSDMKPNEMQQTTFLHFVGFATTKPISYILVCLGLTKRSKKCANINFFAQYGTSFQRDLQNVRRTGSKQAWLLNAELPMLLTWHHAILHICQAVKLRRSTLTKTILLPQQGVAFDGFCVLSFRSEESDRRDASWSPLGCLDWRFYCEHGSNMGRQSDPKNFCAADTFSCMDMATKLY